MAKKFDPLSDNKIDTPEFHQNERATKRNKGTGNND
jgi:hypothetical protein